MAHVERGICPVDGAEDQLLYFLEPTDESLGLACAECIRKRAKTVNRTTPCDKCGAPGAWRNPRTRRDEFLCPTHHAESGDGVIQNPYAARTSETHKLARKLVCAVKDSNCRGGVQPRTLVTEAGTKTSTPLCTRHAGKTSAAWDIEDGVA